MIQDLLCDVCSIHKIEIIVRNYARHSSYL